MTSSNIDFQAGMEWQKIIGRVQQVENVQANHTEVLGQVKREIEGAKTLARRFAVLLAIWMGIFGLGVKAEPLSDLVAAAIKIALRL